ncbi:MAG TPA: DUF1579 domain-containing protein [Reyranella sp.]|nr:DUF1579 domain-containing protein [Reyranella sp.]
MFKSALKPLLNPCNQPSRDFDFLMGIWKCRHRYLVERLADCHDWIEFDGCCAARKILGGWGNSDESQINLPGDSYRGMSVRTWDPRKGLWTIHWFDSRFPGRLAPPVKGAFEKGIGIFHGEDEFKGRPIRVRYLWSRTGEDSARWEQAFSPDRSGSSWETNWYMDFTKV